MLLLGSRESVDKRERAMAILSSLAMWIFRRGGGEAIPVPGRADKLDKLASDYRVQTMLSYAEQSEQYLLVRVLL